MKHINNWLAALIIWFFFLYNVEWMAEPFNLATFVYVFTIACALAIIFLPVLQKLQLYWLLALALPPYLLLKISLGYSIVGQALPLTITEVFATWMTIFLSWQAVRHLNELTDTLSSLIIGPKARGSYSFEAGQGHIYREIRRARQHQAPGTLLAISVNQGEVQANFNRVVKEMQHELVQRYVNARLGKLLITKLQSTDIVTQRNNHFVIFLPQTNKEEASKVISRIEALAEKNLGFTLNVGASTFPEEATTFDRLLSEAEEKMRTPVIQPPSMTIYTNNDAVLLSTNGKVKENANL